MLFGYVDGVTEGEAWGGKLTAGNGEVVHFIVHNHASSGNDKLGAEEGIDCAGDGDGEARMVGGGDVRCAGAVGEEGAVLASKECKRRIILTAKRKKMIKACD